MLELPSAVHRVMSKGRAYYYFQEGRGTKLAGPRTRLPDDPHEPDFWQAIRRLQGFSAQTRVDTVNALADAYQTSPAFLQLAEGTQDQYRRGLRTAREAWGALPASGLRPHHVQSLMDDLADLPGKANTFLGTMRAFSAWGLVRAPDLVLQSFTEGVKSYRKNTGHKPWTPAQIACAHALPPGAIRRGVMLELYTGQRGSDMVRLGWTDIEEGGFRVRQKKTGVEAWCPIVPELSAEMATWEKRPGPFVRQASGAVYTRKLFSIHFRKETAGIPELAGVTLHGLRATAVIRLRREGLEPTQIEDIVGMSLAMITHYCRFADKMANGKAALVTLTRTSAER